MSRAPRTPEDIAAALNPNSEWPGLLEDLKQASLYTDCLGNCVWWTPLPSDTEFTGWIVAAAERLASIPVLTTTKLAETKASKS